MQVLIIIGVQRAAMFIQETTLQDPSIADVNANNKDDKNDKNRQSRIASIRDRINVHITADNKYVQFLASLKDNNIKRLITMSMSYIINNIFSIK